MNKQLNAYIAGPDVFYPSAKEKLDSKKMQLTQQNIMGHTPLDNEIDFNNRPKDEVAFEIAYSNELIMKNSNIILANLDNWHGSPSADVGTAFEMGFMSARYEQSPDQVKRYQASQMLFKYLSMIISHNL